MSGEVFGYIGGIILDNLKKQPKTKNQHYVPQMYIKRFGYGTDDKRRISVLFKDNGKILHNQNPENFACKNYFYDVPREILEEALDVDFNIFPEIKGNFHLGEEQFVEHALSREESQYKKMLDDIGDKPELIYTDEISAIFIAFIHSLAYRTKHFRDTIDEINDKTEGILRKMCHNIGLDDAETEREIKLNCMSGKRQQMEYIVSTVPVLETMNKFMDNYNWYIANNDTKLDFIIGDDPAKPVWLVTNDICIPISKTIAIVLRVKNEQAPLFSRDVPNENVINMTLKGVISYNLIQIAMAQSYLFGSKETIEYMSKFNSLINCTK